MSHLLPRCPILSMQETTYSPSPSLRSLFDEGLVSYFAVTELVPALTGMGMLRNMPRALAEYMLADLNKVRCCPC